jgi:hypothetical protein
MRISCTLAGGCNFLAANIEELFEGQIEGDRVRFLRRGRQGLLRLPADEMPKQSGKRTKQLLLKREAGNPGSRPHAWPLDCRSIRIHVADAEILARCHGRVDSYQLAVRIPVVPT